MYFLQICCLYLYVGKMSGPPGKKAKNSHNLKPVMNVFMRRKLGSAHASSSGRTEPHLVEPSRTEMPHAEAPYVEPPQPEPQLPRGEAELPLPLRREAELPPPPPYGAELPLPPRHEAELPPPPPDGDEFVGEDVPGFGVTLYSARTKK